MLEKIEVISHSAIKIKDKYIIYIDPFRIEKEYKDADYIFITHDHYDHYSEEDIRKVKNIDTKIIVPIDLYDRVSKIGFIKENITMVKPNKKYKINEIEFETIPAYNVNKSFHPKENNWIGYIITVNNKKYYIAGDTDITEENKKVKCDIAFLPIGGVYTMNYEEAASLVNIIKPKIVIPIHYGSVIGTKEDAINFSKLVQSNIECKIILK